MGNTSQANLEPIYELLSTFANYRKLEDLVPAFEASARMLLGCKDVRLLVGEHEETTHPVRIPLISGDVTLGELVASCPIEPEAERTATALASIAAMAIRRDQLLRLARERKALVREMSFARQILLEMLPHSPLQEREYIVSGRLVPANQLGGDCFSYSLSGPDLVHFMLADAVGHGIGSTLLVSECRAVWRTLARDPGPLSKRIRVLNELIYENTGPERFVAACLGKLDIGTGQIEFAACGLAPMLVYRAGEGRVELLERADPPLGIFPDTQFESEVCRLSPGDVFLAVTDGVLEWSRPQGDLFGEERLASHLLTCLQQDSEPLEGIFAALREFGGDLAQRDDACALCIRRQGA